MRKNKKGILSSVVIIMLVLSVMLSGCNKKSTETVVDQASKYPEKPITLLIPYAAGGGVDTIYRRLAAEMSKDLGQPIVCQNVNGGGGQVGFKQIAAAQPDGYTIGATTNSMLLQVASNTGTVGASDVTPIAMINEDAAAIAVGVDSPYKDLAAFIEAAKKEPGKLRVSNSGPKAVWDVSTTMFEKATSTKVTHVPYEGSNPAAVAVAGGHIEAVMTSPPEVKALVDAGKLKVLAVLDKQRYPLFPNVPTLKESGFDLTFTSWRAMIGPKGIPQGIVTKLEASIKKNVASEVFVKFMKDGGYEINYVSSAELGTFMAKQEVELKELLK